MGLGCGFATKNVCRGRKHKGFRYHQAKNDGKKKALVIGQIA